jgi:hypothetical protein
MYVSRFRVFVVLRCVLYRALSCCLVLSCLACCLVQKKRTFAMGNILATNASRSWRVSVRFRVGVTIIVRIGVRV